MIYYEIKGKEGEAKLRGSNDAKGREMKDGRRGKNEAGEETDISEFLKTLGGK